MISHQEKVLRNGWGDGRPGGPIYACEAPIVRSGDGETLATLWCEVGGAVEPAAADVPPMWNATRAARVDLSYRRSFLDGKGRHFFLLGLNGEPEHPLRRNPEWGKVEFGEEGLRQ